MRKLLIPLLGVLILTSMLHAEKISYDNRTLQWSEEFNTHTIDTTVWSKCPRQRHDWANTMSSDSSLFAFTDSTIILRGVINADTIADPSPWLTGGIFTRGKKAFEPGRIEVRARMHSAKGAWPAIWLMPYRGKGWPDCGEIDIMEHLNHDTTVYQTVHSLYTWKDKNTTDPPSSIKAPVDVAQWNTYGVDILPDKIVFHINGEVTLEYPRLPEAEEARQFPFYKAYYLIIDMQLGGRWVGEVEPAELPVEMEVDWARYYSL